MGNDVREPAVESREPGSDKNPTDLIFPRRHHVLFNEILQEKNLKKDREGNVRTFYSLRHTYISMRLKVLIFYFDGD